MLPLDLIAWAVPVLTRHELQALPERLIEHLEYIDGDPNLEDGGRSGTDPTGQ